MILYIYVHMTCMLHSPYAAAGRVAQKSSQSRHAANMKAGRVVQASVMMGCYDLQCTCSELCTAARNSLTVCTHQA